MFLENMGSEPLLGDSGSVIFLLFFGIVVYKGSCVREVTWHFVCIW